MYGRVCVCIRVVRVRVLCLSVSSVLFHIADRLSIYLKFTFYKYPIVNRVFLHFFFFSILFSLSWAFFLTFVASSFDYALLYEGVMRTE